MNANTTMPTIESTHAVELSRVAKIAVTIGFALLLVLSSQWKFPVPGTNVPGTLQTIVVVLAGVALGPRWGTISVLMYLVAGLLISNVFAVAQVTLWSATGGYLFGFLLAQPLIGVITRLPSLHPKEYVIRSLIAAVIAHLVILVCGMIVYAAVFSLPLFLAFEQAILPFLPFTIAKIFTLMLVAPGLMAYVRPHMEPHEV
ncbi:MAG: biotin transporter BioY [Phycisphaerae bacterium]